MMTFGHAAIKQTFATSAGSLLPWPSKLSTLRCGKILVLSILCGYIQGDEVLTLGCVIRRLDKWMTRRGEPLLDTWRLSKAEHRVGRGLTRRDHCTHMLRMFSSFDWHEYC